MLRKSSSSKNNIYLQYLLNICLGLDYKVQCLFPICLEVDFVIKYYLQLMSPEVFQSSNGYIIYTFKLFFFSPLGSY